jgi:hypothetical protein
MDGYSTPAGLAPDWYEASLNRPRESIPPDGPFEVIEREITELWGHVNAATARFLELVRAFDERGCWARHGCRSCAHWLNWQCGIGLGVAREKVRVAQALKNLPAISAAFAAGEISFSKVRAMTRVATPENEDALLNIALHGTAAHMEKVVRLYRRVERLEEAREALAEHQQRYLRYFYDDSGALVVEARLPAEVGAIVMKALEVAEEALMAAESDRASAAGEAGAAGKNVPAATPRWGPAEPEEELADLENTPATRRADALRWLAEHFLNRPPELSDTQRSTDRYQVVVHIDQSLLSDQNTPLSPNPDRPECCAIEPDRKLAVETARRLACDSALVGLVESADREPLSVGRRTRAIPPALRRALTARDGGCTFPGCTATRFTEGHHVRHWADGGETKLTNLTLLCRFHHRLIHEGAFTVERTDDGVFVFRRPDGSRVEAAGRSRGNASGSIQGLKALNEQRGLAIDSNTCASRWGGETLDYDIAISGLCWLRDQPRASPLVDRSVGE